MKECHEGNRVYMTSAPGYKAQITECHDGWFRGALLEKPTWSALTIGKEYRFVTKLWEVENEKAD